MDFNFRWTARRKNGEDARKKGRKEEGKKDRKERKKEQTNKQTNKQTKNENNTFDILVNHAETTTLVLIQFYNNRPVFKLQNIGQISSYSVHSVSLRSFCVNFRWIKINTKETEPGGSQIVTEISASTGSASV